MALLPGFDVKRQKEIYQFNIFPSTKSVFSKSFFTGIFHSY